jgi:virginiamycin B lyase
MLAIIAASRRREGSMRSAARRSPTLMLVTAVFVALLGRPAGAASFTRFALPKGSLPQYITEQPDGTVWYTNPGLNTVGRIALDGSMTEFAVPTPSAFPLDIAVGSDGNVWFTERDAAKVGRITPDGVISEFDLSPAAYPEGIASGPDGGLWVAASGAIDRVGTSGEVTEFPGAGGIDITSGPDDNLWFTSGNRIGRMSVEGHVDLFPIQRDESALFITAGNDGNLWFTADGYEGRFVGRMSPDGHARAIASQFSGNDIASGLDSGVWITGSDSALWRVAPFGRMTKYALQDDGPVGIHVDQNGSIWVTSTGYFSGVPSVLRIHVQG